jgi:hypothetical protein
MLLLERAPEQEAVLSDEGSRINGILRELLSLSEPEIAPLVRTDGSLIAQAQEVQTHKVEYMGTLSALISATRPTQLPARREGRSPTFTNTATKKTFSCLG